MVEGLGMRRNGRSNGSRLNAYVQGLLPFPSVVPFSDMSYIFGVNEAWQLIRMTSELALTAPPQASMAAWGGGVVMGGETVLGRRGSDGR